MKFSGFLGGWIWPGVGIALFLASPTRAAGPPLVDAQSALLVDGATGRILYQKNIAAPHAPASTVKLLTALLVVEHKGLNGTLQVTKEDTAVEPSHIPLIAGETVSVHDLVYALLIGSDNDAAMALARYTAGSVPAFLVMMNARAKELGCTNSNFMSPNGLPMDGQYTTAEDLLKIFQAAIAVPELRTICSTKEFRLTTQAGTRDIENHNKLLGKYPGMGPAKTGWTMESRHTYAAAATRNGHELHLIILDSKDKWDDATKLFDYGFAHESGAPVDLYGPTDAAPGTVAAAPLGARTYTVKKGDTLAAIALRKHCTLEALRQANPQLLNPNRLTLGEILTLPPAGAGH
jgi:D-alanyl-D-alanine carboxypeptidase